jgi:hypothetical protein
MAFLPQMVMAVFIALISGAVCARVAKQMGKCPWTCS